MLDSLDRDFLERMKHGLLDSATFVPSLTCPMPVFTDFLRSDPMPVLGLEYWFRFMPTEPPGCWNPLFQVRYFIPVRPGPGALLRRADIVCTPPAAALDGLPWLLFYAAAIGAGAALLLVIATGRLAYRGEREPVVPS